MSNKRLKAKGTWSIEIYGTCPHCNGFVDFADSDNFFTEFPFEPIGDVKDWKCFCPDCGGKISLDVDSGL